MRYEYKCDHCKVPTRGVYKHVNVGSITRVHNFCSRACRDEWLKTEREFSEMMVDLEEMFQ